MVENLTNYKAKLILKLMYLIINVKRGREVTSVGIPKGAYTLEQGVGQSPIFKCLRRAGSPRGPIKILSVSLKTLKFSSITGAPRSPLERLADLCILGQLYIFRMNYVGY